jgi:hypothetical protein
VAGDQRGEVVEAQVALEAGDGDRDGLQGDAVGPGDAAGEAMSAASWRPQYTFMVVTIQGRTTDISSRRVPNCQRRKRSTVPGRSRPAMG